MKTKRKMKKIISTIIFDKHVAKGFAKVEYYKAQAQNMRMYEHLEREKLRLSTPKISIVTDLIEKQKEMGDTYISPTGKVLVGIYEKNKKAAMNRSIAENTNLMDIISRPETLLLAYRGIKGNKGALSKGAFLPKEKLQQMDDEQKALYLKSLTFPDKFSL